MNYQIFEGSRIASNYDVPGHACTFRRDYSGFGLTHLTAREKGYPLFHLKFCSYWYDHQE